MEKIFSKFYEKLVVLMKGFYLGVVMVSYNKWKESIV